MHATGSSGSRLTINRWPSRVFSVAQVPPPFSVPIQIYSYSGKSTPGINAPVSSAYGTIKAWLTPPLPNSIYSTGRACTLADNALCSTGPPSEPKCSPWIIPRVSVCYCWYAHSQRLRPVRHHDGSAPHYSGVALFIPRLLGPHHQWRGGRRVRLDLGKLPAGLAQQCHGPRKSNAR